MSTVLAIATVANTLTWPGAFAIVGCAVCAAVVLVVWVFMVWR